MDFASCKLEIEETRYLMGGLTFCEWYVGYCSTNSCPVDANVMSAMMSLDAQHGDIPNGWKEKKLERIVANNM